MFTLSITQSWSRLFEICKSKEPATVTPVCRHQPLTPPPQTLSPVIQLKNLLISV